MSDTRTALQNALKEAMVAKDALRRDVIRMVQSAIKQVEIDERKELNEDDVMKIVQGEIKKRREAISEAEKASRAEMAEEERSKLVILEAFLPQQLTRAEVEAFAREAIAQTGATNAKDMGKVMGALMPKVKNKADGQVVNQVVRDLLS
jgi:uncharacterized protein